MAPKSKSELKRDFQKIGITQGMHLMVHSSLSKIGWVTGGAPTVVALLLELLGPEGTLVMPSATPLCLYPKQWNDPSILESQWPTIAENVPLFDLDHTPTIMGSIPETFRNWAGTLRSNHPISSVCAHGKLAEDIVEYHALEMSEGENTPYEKIYDHNFTILLLGVGFNRCTMLHFGESQSNHPRLTKSCYQTLDGNQKKWIEVTDMANDNNTHFPKVGDAFMSQGWATSSKIGAADALVFKTRDLVDFSISYFNSLKN